MWLPENAQKDSIQISSKLFGLAQPNVHNIIPTQILFQNHVSGAINPACLAKEVLLVIALYAFLEKVIWI